MGSVELLCLGEPLVEFNNTAPGQWVESIGGDVSNVAIAARRQGIASGIATRVGADGFGDLLRGQWAREGVDLSTVEVDAAAPTGLYFVRHGPEGHSFEYRREGSAASKLSPDGLPREAISTCRMLHYSGITQAISPSARAAAEVAVQLAREAGAHVSYDPNLRLRLWSLDEARDATATAIATADLALPGLEDARVLTGLSDPENIVRHYIELGAGIVALTLGADGALVGTAEQVVAIPAPPARLVDATGAGDCFDGAFLAEWLRTRDPFAAGRYAVVAAALSVQGYGAVDAIPTRSAVTAATGAASLAGPGETATGAS